MKGKKLITIISIVCILAVMLCIPAFATVTESDGNGFALYNGYKLPVLPEYDESKYTFSFVGKDESSGEIYFVCCGELYRARTDGFVGWASPTYTYVLSDGEWEFVSYDHYVGHYTAGDYAPVMWVSRDVYDEYETSQLNYSFTSPIPLDGYNIIEWDGDTTGLNSITISPLSYYRLADYFSAVSAVCVISDTDGSRVVHDNFNNLSEYGWTLSSSTNTIAVAGLTSDGVSEISPGSPSGVYFTNTFINEYHQWCSLLAYRTTEAPPDEGGGTDPDDPQPPLGG